MPAARGATLVDWLTDQGEHAQLTSVSATLIELAVTYKGRPVDPSRVILHRFGNPVGSARDHRAADRPVIPGEFLG